MPKGLRDLFRRRRAAPAVPLDVRVSCFREVLHANNAALGHIARIQEALDGDVRLSAPRVQRLVAGVVTQTHRMIVNLNRMTGGAFQEIADRFAVQKEEIRRRVEVSPTLKTVGYIAPLADLDASMSETFGQKSALLGEANRLMPGRVPRSFGTSVHAFWAFMAADHLGEKLADILAAMPPDSVEGCFEASAQATQLVESTRVPDALAAEIQAGMAAIGRKSARVAVRSSALREGGLEMSFAGQYRSLLNVPASRVVDGFRSVVASKYSPEAIAYRTARGFEDHEVAMCCCVMEMIDAVAAGVMFSGCETDGRNAGLIQAVRGLGQSAVDGSAEPDSYWVDCKSRSIVERRRGLQLWRIAPSATEGTLQLPVESLEHEFILTDRQVVSIAALAHRLESLVGSAVDMEWALTRDGAIHILQLRPQPGLPESTRKRDAPAIAGYEVLLQAGSQASPGAASGPVFRVERDLDILRCPRGAVVITRYANPRFAVLLRRVAAVIADMGELTGHLAAVARELKVPALFATRVATDVLQPGTIVTVDAGTATVYRGQVPELVAATLVVPAARARDPHREILASVAERIVPLTLTDRLASGYSAKACRTLHDIIRFCHQATIEAMFEVGDQALRRGDPLHRLRSAVPIDCRVFDMGDGLKDAEPGAEVTIDQVACRPMIALWRGMTDPRVEWNRARPVSLPGIMSAMVNYNFDQDSRMRPMGEPSFVFVTGDYLNLNSRLGYHFSTVDARVGDIVESNYVSFRFVGGSTGIEQRSRRAILLERILRGAGFETDRRADLLTARLRHRPARMMEDALVTLGRLMGYVNHLDMALTSDEVARNYERAFLAEDYGFAERSTEA